VTQATPIVFLVDDDASARRGVERLLRSAGHRVETFASAAEFLQRGVPAGPCCLVLDVRMPGQSGLDLQKVLAASGCRSPIVFITGNADLAMAAQAMDAGAVAFLTKPFHDEDLLDAVARCWTRAGDASGADDASTKRPGPGPSDPPSSGWRTSTTGSTTTIT
jgi:FixJ family two-component response regulator